MGQLLAAAESPRIIHAVLANTTAVIKKPQLLQQRCEQLQQQPITSISANVIEKWLTLAIGNSFLNT